MKKQMKVHVVRVKKGLHHNYLYLQLVVSVRTYVRLFIYDRSRMCALPDVL